MLSKLKLAAAVLFVMGVTLAAVAQPQSAADHPAPLPYGSAGKYTPVGIEAPPDAPADRLDGILKAIDLDKKTLQIMVTRDKDEDLTFDLAAEVAVTVNGFRLGFKPKEGTLVELKPGMRVRIRLVGDKKSVAAIDEQRSQQGAARRDCPKCKSTCGLELSREWCDSFALYKGQLTCWCEIAQYVIGTGGGRSAESQKVTEKEWDDVMDRAYADARKGGKLLLHIGNTGG